MYVRVDLTADCVIDQCMDRVFLCIICQWKCKLSLCGLLRITTKWTNSTPDPDFVVALY